MTRQFIRSCTLSLSGASGSGGGMVVKGGGPTDVRVAFEIESHTLQSPDLAQFTPFNVSAQTASKVQKEFTEVVFSAGYEDGEGEIFRVSIVETQSGEKIDGFTTTLLRIWCANSDLAYRAPLNTTLAAGSTHQDVVKAALQAMQKAQPGFTMGHVVGVDLSQPKFPRRMALVGAARDYLNEICLSLGANFTLSNNKLTIIGKASQGIGPSGITLSSTTGLINQPIHTTASI